MPQGTKYYLSSQILRDLLRDFEHAYFASLPRGCTPDPSSASLRPYISFNLNPAPISSSSLPANIPLKSASSPSLGAAPLIGAFGLATRLRFSCPAFDGNVGNIAVDFGFGSSLKYGCASISLAVGRAAGLRARSDVKRALPAVVRKGNLARMTAPTVWEVWGRRRDFALGRRRKEGQVCSVGMPQSSKICSGG